MNFMVTTNQESTKDTPKKLKEPKYNTKENQQTRDQEQRSTKTSRKAMNKIAISTYLSITNLNVNGLNTPIKTKRLSDRIKEKKMVYCF